MAEKISQEMNLILQSYYTVALLSALSTNNNLVGSEYYKSLNLDFLVRDGIEQVGIDNQGCALMTLYAMLVIPKELISNKYSAAYDAIDLKLASLTIETNSTYGESPVRYLKHIRNAVAHARVSFAPGESITFEDRDDKKGHRFTTTMPLRNLGQLLNEL